MNDIIHIVLRCLGIYFVNFFYISDSESVLYSIGDFIDMKDREQGAWFEAKIVRIVHNIDALPSDKDLSSNKEANKQNKENDPENKQQELTAEKPKNSIAMYLVKSPKRWKNCERNKKGESKTDVNLLYKVQIQGE